MFTEAIAIIRDASTRTGHLMFTIKSIFGAETPGTTPTGALKYSVSLIIW